MINEYRELSDYKEGIYRVHIFTIYVAFCTWNGNICRFFFFFFERKEKGEQHCKDMITTSKFQKSMKREWHNLSQHL